MSKKAIVTAEGAKRYNLPKDAIVEYERMQASRVPGSDAMFLENVTYKGEKIAPSMTLEPNAVLKNSTKSKKV